MKKIGFLGCGKIGQALLKHIKEKGYGQVVFIEDPFADLPGEPVVRSPREELYGETELVIECCTADVLKEHIELILKHGRLRGFSADSRISGAACAAGRLFTLKTKHISHTFYPFPANYSRILPSVEIVTTCQGMNFPLFFSAVTAACSIPPQQGTSMRTTVSDRISFSRMICSSFSV